MSLVNIYAAWLIVMNGRQKKLNECTNMGKVKRLKFWWQLYVMSLPEQDVWNFRLLEFCCTECTYYMCSCTLHCHHTLHSVTARSKFRFHKCFHPMILRAILFPLISISYFNAEFKEWTQTHTHTQFPFCTWYFRCYPFTSLYLTPQQ